MDLSSQHRSFFERTTPFTFRQGWQFIIGVYHADKWRELLSYVRWEARHRLGLFRTDQYVRFTDHQPLILDSQSAPPLHFDDLTSVRACRADQPWRLLLSGPGQRGWGCLFTDETGFYVTDDGGRSVRLLHRFAHPIQSVYRSEAGHLYVCSRGCLYRSTTQGATFQPVLTLSSPASYFLFDSGMTELPDGRLLLGEYGVTRCGYGWQNVAYVYWSTDGGERWQSSDFLIRNGVNKHVHLTKYSPRLNAVVLTDGDNKKQLWLHRSPGSPDGFATTKNAGWQRINASHYQTGGYLSMTDVNDAVLFGSDYLGGTNFIFSTTDGQRFTRQVVPDPYRRSPVMQLATRRTRAGKTEVWAVLHNSIASVTRSLLMYSSDAGQTWTRVIDYDGTRHEIKLVSSSAPSTDRLHIGIITRQGGDFTNAVYVLNDV